VTGMWGEARITVKLTSEEWKQVQGRSLARPQGWSRNGWFVAELTRTLTLGNQQELRDILDASEKVAIEMRSARRNGLVVAEPRTAAVLKISVTFTQREGIRTAAARFGLTVAGYARAVLTDADPRLLLPSETEQVRARRREVMTGEGPAESFHSAMSKTTSGNR